MIPGDLEDSEMVKLLVQAYPIRLISSNPFSFPIDTDKLDLCSPLINLRLVLNQYVGHYHRLYATHLVQEHWIMGMDGWEHEFLYGQSEGGCHEKPV
jgi:hypothetical protein